MKKSNLLDDIEKDICGDWNKIRLQIKNKEEEKVVEEEVKDLLENKTRWHLPDLNQFLELLIRATNYYSKEAVLGELQILIHRIISENGYGEKLPKSFEKVWEMFCRPYKYNIINVYCDCGKKFNVFYEYISEFNRREIRGFSDPFTFREMKMNKIHCFNCGKPMYMKNSKVIGIFEE